MSVNTIPYSNRTLGGTCIIQIPASLEDLVASSNAINDDFAFELRVGDGGDGGVGSGEEILD